MNALAEKVARNAEFAGFGPCVAIDDRTIKCHREGKILTHVLPSPTPALAFANSVDPVIQETFALLRDIYGAGSYQPDLTEIKFHPKIITRTYYLWMDDFAENTRLVLLELRLDGLPVWHLTYTLPYDAKVDPSRWEKVAELFDNFLSNVTAAKHFGITDAMLRECSTAAKMRAGKEA